MKPSDQSQSSKSLGKHTAVPQTINLRQERGQLNLFISDKQHPWDMDRLQQGQNNNPQSFARKRWHL